MSCTFLFLFLFFLPFSIGSLVQNLSGSGVSCSSISTQTSSRTHWAFWKSAGGSLGLVLSLWLGSTLISMGSKFVLFTLSAISGRVSHNPEISSSPGLRTRRNSGAISLLSKGKSHSTQASAFDLGVLLPYNFFWLLKLYGFFFLLNNFDMKWKFLFRFLFLFLHLLGCPFCRSLQGVTFRSG